MITASWFAEPTHNGLWYIADGEMRNVTGAFFNSKAEAVAEILAKCHGGLLQFEG
jgi:hypothetical protein